MVVVRQMLWNWLGRCQVVKLSCIFKIVIHCAAYVAERLVSLVFTYPGADLGHPLRLLSDELVEPTPLAFFSFLLLFAGFSFAHKMVAR